MNRFQANSKVAKIRERLDHPVIDSDGHLWEFTPVVMEYVAKAGGRDILERFDQERRSSIYVSRNWYGLSDAERVARWTHRPPFWGDPLRNHGLDLATCTFPDLLYRRLDELGLDFTVLYPSIGIVMTSYLDDATRRASCRGFNDYYADYWMSHPDRMTPAAAIPMNTPSEAIEELEYTVRKRGFKVAMFPSFVRRPIKAAVDKYPDMARYAWRADTFGIDSEYDYDPVWQKCRELGISPTFHGAGAGSTFNDSISNFVYNHLGHFAIAGTAICKSLFLGGVSQRFPDLKFLFLEGGVGWARSMLADLTSHWEKFSLQGFAQNSDPRLADVDLYMDLFREYGGKLYRDIPRDTLAKRWEVNPEDPTDSFAALKLSSKEELRQLFVNSFYFGCEGDDPITPSAFDAKRNPGRVRLNATYGSDIGHFDVPVLNEIMEELYEPVEKGLMEPADLRDFVFTNPLRFWTATNPDFFKGTVVEQAVAKAVRV